MSAAGRIPCTIVTGFLGAGKTTLIRNLLTHPGGRRFAVIVNEFGDVGIDGEVLKGCGIDTCPEENVVELANGCICCTVADDFQPALETILAARPAVDHILIETSGLALPKPLVQAFQWPDIRSRVTVDGVVAVVDGAALAAGQVAGDLDALAAQRAADDALDHDDPIEEVFEDQVACADLVILSKVDLLDAAARTAAERQVTDHLGRAVKIVAARDGQVDTDVLLGLDADAAAVIDQRRTHHDGEEDHEHDDFDSFVVALDMVADPQDLVRRVTAAGALPEVLRVKGFAEVAGKPMRLVVQGVGARVQHHFDRPWRPDESRGTRLVVIGLSGLDRARIEAVLAA